MKKEVKKTVVPENKKETAGQDLKKSGKRGKTPKRVVRKHIRDKNDVITEEDFKNLDISVGISNDSANEVLEIPDDKGGFPAQFKGTGIAGGSEGVNAVFITNGQTGYTIIVLSNYDPPSAEKPGTQIRDWLKQIKE